VKITDAVQNTILSWGFGNLDGISFELLGDQLCFGDITSLSIFSTIQLKNLFGASMIVCMLL
jgi:hypothetical protein